MSAGINVVTGGRGHVGFALVKELADRGEKIRLILRSDSHTFDGIECEKVIGDVCDYESLEKAFEGAETVYHVAGVVDITGTKDKQVWAVNVEGTKNVVRACKEKGVKKLIYVSSVDAVHAGMGNEVISEPEKFEPDILDSAYAKSKATASQFVIDSGDENFKVCSIHPSACIGPYDNNRTSSMCTVISLFYKGLLPLTFDFGIQNFVDVRNVAKGMVAAAEKGRNGECYFLCSKACTLDNFMCTLADACGKKHPSITIRKKHIDKIIPVFEKVFEFVKLPPIVNDYAIQKTCENSNFSFEKAKRELGYEPRPLIDSLRDSVAWLKEDDLKKKKNK